MAELPKLEKMSNAQRQKHAKKRRKKQLVKWREWEQTEGEPYTPGATLRMKERERRIHFDSGSHLNEAVMRDDLAEVRRLLSTGVSSSIANADGLTPLHRCCIENTKELAELLLEYDADVDARDIEGWTPLHAACATGNLQMINVLVEHDASLTSTNNDDCMPIDVAADSDIRHVMKQKMIDAGLTDDLLQRLRENTPKSLLADLKDSVRSNRSLDIKDKYGATAMHIAAANGYMESLTFLIEHGASMNEKDKDGWTPFHAAVCWQQREVMKLLAEKGANLDVRNHLGETPYAIADDPDIRQLVLELKSVHKEANGTLPEGSGGGDEEGDPLECPRARSRSMNVRRGSIKDRGQLGKEEGVLEARIRQDSVDEQYAEAGLPVGTDEMSTAEPTTDTIAFSNKEENAEEVEPEKSSHPHRVGKSVLRTHRNHPTPYITSSPHTTTHTAARSAPGRDCCAIL